MSAPLPGQTTLTTQQKFEAAGNTFNAFADAYATIKSASRPEEPTVQSVSWIPRSTEGSSVVAGGLMFLGAVAIILLVISAVRK